MAAKTLKQLAERKCAEYGVSLDRLLALGWRLLDVDQCRATGDLLPNVTEDQNFLGALKIPLQNVDDSPIMDNGKPFHRYRLFHTAALAFGIDLYKGKRYRQAPRTTGHVFFPQCLPMADLARDIDVPVLIVEGEPKCMALAEAGHLVIGLPGVDFFSKGGDLLEEFRQIEWVGRTAVICYDKDWREKVGVLKAIHRLGKYLRLLGADPWVLKLPEDGPKAVDEYAVEHGIEAFEELLESDACVAFDAFADFDANQQGNIRRDSTANIQLAITKLGYGFQFNEMNHSIEVFEPAAVEAVTIQDHHLSDIIIRTDTQYKFLPSDRLVQHVIAKAAHDRPYHPVRDYLDQLSWDGTERLDTWLTEALGARDCELNRAIGRPTLMGAAARALYPGCKFDQITVLEGPQGIGKSSAVRALCPREEWFSDSIDLNHSPKQIIEEASQFWIHEAPEIDSMTKAEVGKVKAMVSRQKDTARTAYARFATTVPRSFTIIGTANKHEYLRDETGNRRFWPVTCTKADPRWVVDHRDALWAEAVVRLMRGESLVLPQSLWKTAQEEQEKRTMISAVQQKLTDWLGTDDAGKVAYEDIWLAFGCTNIKDRTNQLAHDIREAMRALGFRRSSVKVRGVSVSGFARGDLGMEDSDAWWEVDATVAAGIGGIVKLVRREAEKQKGGRGKKRGKVTELNERRTRKY